ncbi:MAG TPA: hypothetical protein VF708_19840 [Pyrinomonadaceae bacterium]
MGDNPEEDRYTRFLQLYYAVPDDGAELYFQDFLSRHEARMAPAKAVRFGAAEAVDDFLRAAGRFISALYRREGEQVVKEGNKVLQILGSLIAFGRALQSDQEDEGEGSRRKRSDAMRGRGK